MFMKTQKHICIFVCSKEIMWQTYPDWTEIHFIYWSKSEKLNKYKIKTLSLHRKKWNNWPQSKNFSPWIKKRKRKRKTIPDPCRGEESRLHSHYLFILMAFAVTLMWVLWKIRKTRNVLLCKRNARGFYSCLLVMFVYILWICTKM